MDNDIIENYSEIKVEIFRYTNKIEESGIDLVDERKITNEN